MIQPRPRPQLAWDNSQLQQCDDLALAVATLKNSVRFVHVALRVVVTIALQQARARFHRFMQSLIVSWAFAGLGWGGFIGLAATLFLAR